MIPIVIDMSDVISEFSLSKKDSDGLMSFVIRDITARFARTWADEAKRGLVKARANFVRSLIIGEEGPFKGYVMLVGQLPNMIESGASPFDMKKGFLASSKAKDGTNGGKYLTIPFRLGTPGSLGSSEVFSGVMPEEIYQAIKNKGATKTTMGGKTSSGTKLDLMSIPGKYQIPSSRPRIELKNKVFEEYKHKTSIYEGLTKSSKGYENKTSGQYTTFRRVSTLGSDPNSWIHRGITARNFSGKALSRMDIPSAVDKSTDNYLANLGL